MPRMKGEPTVERQIVGKPGYLPEGQRPCCRWCGKRLRPTPVLLRADGSFYQTGFPSEAACIRYGYDGDNIFCTLRCGYSYGLREASGDE